MYSRFWRRQPERLKGGTTSRTAGWSGENVDHTKMPPTVYSIPGDRARKSYANVFLIVYQLSITSFVALSRRSPSNKSSEMPTHAERSSHLPYYEARHSLSLSLSITARNIAVTVPARVSFKRLMSAPSSESQYFSRFCAAQARLRFLGLLGRHCCA